MFHALSQLARARLLASLAIIGVTGAGVPAAPVRAQATAAALKPGVLDRERAHFPLCQGPRRFTCVVDGDTIWYRGAKIRLADIDAPEVARPRCPREAELGRKATKRLQSLLNAAPFRLEPAPDGRQQDRFGRQLKVVKRGPTSIGSVLVREGLARRWGSQWRGWC
ncbi:MAG: thermonuclease family protein [Erythrobacter sp.]